MRAGRQGAWGALLHSIELLGLQGAGQTRELLPVGSRRWLNCPAIFSYLNKHISHENVVKTNKKS